jgi:hypothetical protein
MRTRRLFSLTHDSLQVFPGPNDADPDTPVQKPMTFAESCCGPMTLKEMHKVMPCIHACIHAHNLHMHICMHRIVDIGIGIYIDIDRYTPKYICR